MDYLILTVILSGTTLLYLFFTIAALLFPSKKNRPSASGFENLSVVIPFRNEAAHLASLLHSLEQQIYPVPFEIILVNDNSDDASLQIVQRIQQNSSLHIHVINSGSTDRQHLTSKQQALLKGIHATSYDCIVLTDADMTFDQRWLLSLGSAVTPETDLVFGHSAIRPDRTLFTLLQSFQLEFLFSIAAVFHYGGITGSCMGNNLLLRKKSFFDCGGFDAIGYTITEDRALLRHFRKNHKKVRITQPFIPAAFTLPHTSVKLFIQQARRWISGGFTNGLNLLCFGLVFSFQHSTTYLALFGGITGLNRLIALGNFFILWGMLYIAFKKNRSPVSVLYYPVFHLFVLIEILVFPIVMITGGKITWKGLRVR